MDAAVKVAELKASRGAAWLTEAFALFRRAPMAWLGLCAGWIAITFGLILLPFIGGVLANFLQPVFFASFAIAAYRQTAGERVVMIDLFAAFKRNMRPLVNLGALLLLAEIAIFAFMALLGLPMAASGERSFTLEEYVGALKGKEWILATGFLMTVVVTEMGVASVGMRTANSSASSRATSTSSGRLARSRCATTTRSSSPTL